MSVIYKVNILAILQTDFFTFLMKIQHYFQQRKDSKKKLRFVEQTPRGPT